MSARGDERGAAAAPPPQVLREYALVADGERGAVIGPRGDVCWMCVPRWDSGSVFGSLIGAAGHYSLGPADRHVWGGYYEDGSLIWRSRWPTTSAVVECREAMAAPARQDRAVLLRQVRAGSEPAQVRVVLAPVAGYGEHPPTECRRGEDGRWSARLGPLHLRWSGGEQARMVDTDDGTAWLLDLVVPAGGQHDLVLEIGEGDLGTPVDPGVAWQETETWWRAAMPEAAGAAPRDATHAMCVLRGLTSSSGGMVAAATTSLPERMGGTANFDYRYVWVRDQCLAAQAAARAGHDGLLDDAVRFLGARLLADGPDLAPAYTVSGGPVPDERRLGVPGYPGGGDRIGNRGGGQFQLDAFGEVLLVLAEAARRDRLDTEGWRAVTAAVDAIERRWQEPDAGMWELEPRWWTHSRLICVAGLRAIGRAVGGPTGPAGRWSALADEIMARTARDCTHPDGRWQRAADDPRHDGALLLPALRGALPVEDPRSDATLRSYLADLTRQGYAFRFRPDDRELGAAEGAFLLCNFVTALACHQQGDPLQARHFFERARSACGPAGLFAEEYDVTQRQLRGNLPQAFVHALLLECSATLDPIEAT